MKTKKIITEDDMERMEQQIDRINIKMLNWKLEIYEKVYRTRIFLMSIFVILIVSVIVSFTI